VVPLVGVLVRLPGNFRPEWQRRQTTLPGLWTRWTHHQAKRQYCRRPLPAVPTRRDDETKEAAFKKPKPNRTPQQGARLDHRAPRPGGGQTHPRRGREQSMGYIATLALLQASDGGRHLRPDLGIQRKTGGEQDQGFAAGDARQVLARLRKASTTLRGAIVGRSTSKRGMPMEATSTLGETADDFTPLTPVSSDRHRPVKFWAICMAPTEIDDGHQPVWTSVVVDKPGRRLAGSNLVAGVHVELSKKRTR